jgi:probable phosphoglycerate mutase
MEQSVFTRLTAVRHGETAWNVDTRLQGQLDVPLNSRGREQARLLAQALKDEPPQAIYSSDLQRARDTAQAVGAVVGLAVQEDAGLRERHFGIWQGQTYAEVEAGWPELAERWRRREPAFGPEGGETLQGFFERSVAAVSAIVQRHAGESVLIVSHGGVLDCLYRAATHLALDAPRTWQLPNTGINRLLCTAKGYSLVGWGDVHHLDGTASLDTGHVLDESADRVGPAA